MYLINVYLRLCLKISLHSFLTHQLKGQASSQYSLSGKEVNVNSDNHRGANSEISPKALNL